MNSNRLGLFKNIQNKNQEQINESTSIDKVSDTNISGNFVNVNQSIEILGATLEELERLKNTIRVSTAWEDLFEDDTVARNSELKKHKKSAESQLSIAKEKYEHILRIVK